MPQSAPMEGEVSARAIRLPDAPADLSGPVKAWREDVEIITYAPERPDQNPMFLERRVYQGSSGRVYPLPFIDRIATEPELRKWQAIHIENEYLRLMILPEIGGRIHVGYDKSTGYDFFYRQNVIKPALVGLAGPWISGGVEFNWPQHHRPATFMPVETEIEQAANGSVTVWCSDHDPMLRMKGMHGVCLHPGRALIDLKVRLYNRTPLTQTFLWWANVAARVHEKYQSFFPLDVQSVADHAKRAVTTFPLSDGCYYGVDYGERGKSGVPEVEKPRKFVPDGTYAPNDLSWYANIPVPTSYMVTGTEQDFFGGYDHEAEAGIVHVANHHIAPGKKQWTWGNHEFGYAWDRSLTDHDGPYIELMAGVYTDNQPDFSYLAPWETKTFTQNWYPIRRIGAPVIANLNSALHVGVRDRVVQIGLCVTRPVESAVIVLRCGGGEIARWAKSLSVSDPLLLEASLPAEAQASAIAVVVSSPEGCLIEFDQTRIKPAKPAQAARQPKPPEGVESVEELYLIGVHLEQYRHATRSPEPYWREGLRRDPNESRIHNALGQWHLRRGEFAEAAEHFESAIARLTALNPNPRDSEPYYYLGLTRRYQGRDKEAYAAFYKAAWSAAWRSAAYFALSECDAANGEWRSARNHLQLSLRADVDNLNARNLLGIVFTKLGDSKAADAVFRETLTIDPLDAGARWHRGEQPANGQECLDLAFDLLRAGQYQIALDVLQLASLDVRDGSVPMILFTTAFVRDRLGYEDVRQTLLQAESAPVDYCFPSRLEEMLVLEWAMKTNEDLWSAPYLLGNLLYDKRRHAEAMRCWEDAARKNTSLSVVHRNLGIACFNIEHNPVRALDCYDRALQANPFDGRVLYERDQLWKRRGKSPEIRLQGLLRYPRLVEARDDLTVEVATLYNQLGRSDDAMRVLLARKFQPWEGGEGLVLTQYARARLLRGRRALVQGDLAAAREEFLAALEPPVSLGEAWHLLANQSDIYYWLGEALSRDGWHESAIQMWQHAAQARGDFQQMAAREVSNMTFWTALALKRLGREEESQSIFQRIHDLSCELEHAEPEMDYFATSLPAMLLFEEDLHQRNRMDALFLRAQAFAGLNRKRDAQDLLSEVLAIDANHQAAADLFSQLRNDDETAMAN
jgi:tetratricopeptide (TPR) repeat protein